MRRKQALCLVIFVAAMSIGSLPVAAQFCAPPKAMPQPPPASPPPAVCEPKECDKCTKSPCYISSGIYARDEVDLQIRTAGSFPLTAGRHYDTSRLGDGPLGSGWSSSLTARLFYATYLLAAPNTYTHEADILMPEGAIFRFTVDSGGSFVPPFGRHETLVRNADGSYSMTLQHSRSVYHFNSDGSLDTMTDDYGNAVKTTYDSSARITRIADQAGSGRYIDVTWGADGRIAALTDSASRQVKYYYDSASGVMTGVSNPIVASDAAQRSTYYTYVAGRFGSVLSRIEDRWHRLISRLDWYPDGKLKSYTEGDYNDAIPSASTGEKYTYAYLSNNNGPYTTKTSSLGSQSYPFDANGIANNDTSQFDSLGQTIQSSSGNGSAQYAYDTQGRVIGVTQDTITWSLSYDSTFPNNILSMIPHDSGGGLSTKWAGWTYEYYSSSDTAPGALKAVHRLRSDTVTADLVAQYTYDSHGRITSWSNENVVSTSYQYNAAGDLTQTSSPSNTNTYAYDSLGRVTSTADASGHATTMTYDALDRVVTVTLPVISSSPTLDFSTHYSYDNYDSTSGLLFLNITDPNGRTIKKGSDALGRLVQEVDATNAVTAYVYQYNLLSTVRDANGNETSYAYDSTRRLIKTTFPDGAVETYAPSADGAPLGITDRKGQGVSYSFDGFGRLAVQTYAGLTSPGGPDVGTHYTYDGQNLKHVSYQTLAGVTGIDFTYDSSWRLLTETRSGSDTLTYGYSNGVNPLVRSVTIEPAPQTGGAAQTISYGYTADRLSSINWSWIPGTFYFGYTANGQYSTITFPNGQTRTFAYDEQGRLTQLANQHPTAGNLATFDYAYDYDWSTGGTSMLGQRTSVTVTAPPSASQTTGTSKYFYDPNYQLTRRQYPNGSYESWTYDAIGNRTSKVLSGVTNYAYTYYTNGAGLNTQRLRSDGTGDTDFTYDANGNMTGTATSPSQFVWDYASRLVGNAGTTYDYDFDDRLVGSTSGGSTMRYTRVGLGVFGERNVATSVSTHYLSGPGIDELLAKRTANGSVYYFDVDGLGSVTAANDPDGGIAEGDNYSAWGERVSGSGLFGYTGREAMGSLWYNRARFYDPARGRFISEDPIDFQDGSNRYAYAVNSPALYYDPLGLARQKGKRECEELARKIANIRKAIAQKARKLADNPNELPFCVPGGKPRESQLSHYKTLEEYKENLAGLEQDYSENCGGGGPPAVPVPIPLGGRVPKAGEPNGGMRFPIPVPEPPLLLEFFLPLIHPCRLHPSLCEPKNCYTCGT